MVREKSSYTHHQLKKKREKKYLNGHVMQFYLYFILSWKKRKEDLMWSRRKSHTTSALLKLLANLHLSWDLFSRRWHMQQECHNHSQAVWVLKAHLW